MKKVLIVASVISFIEWFNKENVDYLRCQKGCQVHIACNFDYTEDTDEDRTRAYIEKLKSQGVVLHNIAFARSPFELSNIQAYRQLKAIIAAEKFDLIHCHTPTVSMMTRLAARKARKQGSIVMYTAHGFHFHDASPKKNWLMYYPVELVMSRFCDYLITMNNEDFNRSKTFHCKNVRYIPGVGVDIKLIQSMQVDKSAKKESIGIPSDSIMLLSVGEMIARKNHEVIIRALAQLDNPNLYYAIAGKGPLKEYLQMLAHSLGIGDRVIFLGFRTDVFELYHAADICAYPSKMEGLGLAGVEALAAGVPLVASNVRGIHDYVIDGVSGYTLLPTDVAGYAAIIKRLAESQDLRKKLYCSCIQAAMPFDIHNALSAMWSIYDEILGKKGEL